MYFPKQVLLVLSFLVAVIAGLTPLLFSVMIIGVTGAGVASQVPGVFRYVLWLNLAFCGLALAYAVACLWLCLRQVEPPDNARSKGASMSSDPDVSGKCLTNLREGAGCAREVGLPCSGDLQELVHTLKEMLEALRPLILSLATKQEVAVAAPSDTFCPLRGPIKPVEDNGEQELWPDFPKGLNKVTLKQILAYLEEHNETGVSAEEIATGVGISRVTVRRYMDYLEQIGYVKVELRYGTVGRPLKIYTLVNLFGP